MMNDYEIYLVLEKYQAQDVENFRKKYLVEFEYVDPFFIYPLMYDEPEFKTSSKKEMISYLVKNNLAYDLCFYFKNMKADKDFASKFNARIITMGFNPDGSLALGFVFSIKGDYEIKKTKKVVHQLKKDFPSGHILLWGDCPPPIFSDGEVENAIPEEEFDAAFDNEIKRLREYEQNE